MIKEKLKKVLAMSLTLCMLVPSIAFAADVNGEEQAEEKVTNAVEQEVQSETLDKTNTSSEPSDSPELTVSVSGNGNAITKIDGLSDENLIDLEAGESKSFSLNKGEKIYVKTYAVDGNNAYFSNTGCELVSATSGVLTTERVYKVLSDKATLKINFSGGPKENSSTQPVLKRFAAPRAASSMSTTITKVKSQYGYDASGSNFEYNKYTRFNATGAYNSAAYCAEHSRDITASSVTGYVISDTTIRKILYYGYRGPKQWSGFACSTYNSPYVLWGDNTNKTEICGVVVTAQALSDRYKSLGGTGISCNPSGLSAFVAFVNSQPDPGSSWTVYKASASGQDMMWGVYNPNGDLKLQKSAAENEDIVAECPNMYSLEGAEYEVRNGNGTVVGVLKTDKNGNSNTLSLPPATYTVKETKAPMGYALDNNTYTVTVTLGGTYVLNVQDVPMFDPVRIVLQKTATEDSYVNKSDMSDAEFEIAYYDTLSKEEAESIEPTRVWNLKTIEGRGSLAGKYVSEFHSDYILEGSDELFKIVDDLGVERAILPRGIVTIRESKAPTGYKVDPMIYYLTVDNDEDNTHVTYNFGAVPEQPNAPLVPYLKTKASDLATEDNVGSFAETVNIKDEVSYYELTDGETYTIKGILYDKETGEKLLDKNGKAYTDEVTFTVNEDNSTIDGKGARGSVDFNYSINNAKELKGKSVVCCVAIYWHGEELATHMDFDNEDQTIHFPELRTTASSEETDSNLGMPREEEVIKDVVKYENLIAGKEYTVKGVLMDKKTNKPLLNEDGEEYTDEVTFTPNESEGEVTLSFTVKSIDLQGETTVVFEDMYHNDKLVGVHADIKDEGQSIHYPDIHTSANLDKNSIGKDGILQIVDVVKYTNLSPDREYTVTGILMAKETGKPLLVGGREVTKTVKFTPTKKDGEVRVVFEVPADALVRSDDGSSTVVFEKLYDSDIEIAHHEDINDEGQTIGVGIMTVSYGENGYGIPNTGDSTNKFLFYVLVLTAAGLSAASVMKKRKEDE